MQNDFANNESESKNPGEQNVYKRPRGRPKLTAEEKKKYREKCIIIVRPRRSILKQNSSMAEGKEETPMKNRPIGRPKLSKSLASLSNMYKSEMNERNDANQKRARGRPMGSVKRKRRHSFSGLTAGVTKRNRTASTMYENVAENRTETCPSTFEAPFHNQSTLNDKSLTPNTKRGRGRPPGAKNKPKTVKLQPKGAKLKMNSTQVASGATKSKQIYQASNVRDIPKHRFDESIIMLTNPEHPIWEDRNTSCNKSIHRHWDEYATALSDHNLRIKFARQFLMRRDWINLSKVLSISLQDVVTQYNSYYSLFTKYASICLAHTDKQQFNKFVQFLLKTEDSGKVLKKCTQFSQNCSDEEEV